MTKRNKIFVACCLLFITCLNAQVNLVLNPSFEQVDSCPTGANQASRAKYWDWVNSGCINTFGEGDGEYFTPCCTFPLACNTPSNGFTYQEARTGNSYISLESIYSYPPANNNIRDYLKDSLASVLQAGKTYCLTFYYNAANHIMYGTNRFGAYVDNGAVSGYSCFKSMPVTPQVQNNPAFFMTDTLNWIKIQGSFTAIGNENTLTLGNFVDSATIQFQLFNSSGTNSPTYLIDDVSLLPTDLPAFAGHDTSLCKGDSVYIGRAREIGLNDDCIWYLLGNTIAIDTIAGIWVKPNATTSYVVEQNICGTITYDTVTVSIKNLLNISALSNTFVCKGDSIQIGDLPLINVNYQWQPITNISNPTASQTYVSPNITTTYTLIATPTINSNYCFNIKDSISLQVAVKPKLKGNVVLSASATNICPNQSVQLQASVTNSVGLQWSWQPANILNNSFISNPAATPSVNTNFQLIATTNSTSIYCSSDTSQISIRVIKLQSKANAGRDTIFCESSASNKISVGSSANLCSWCTYNWQPIIGLQNSNSANTNVNTNQLAIGNNKYFLIKTDSCQTTKDTVNIFVKNCNSDSVKIIVPNIFTPNSDGKNDTWSMIVLNGIEIFDLETTIYNRWGEKVFESTNIHQNWDGNNLYEGSPCSSDTYFYIISYTDGNINESITLKGFMEIVR